MPTYRLRLEFRTKAALQAFLATAIFDDEGYYMGCTPTGSGEPEPPPDTGTTPPNAPPVGVLTPLTGVTVADLWSFSLAGTGDPEGLLASVSVSWGDGTPDTSVAVNGGEPVDEQVFHTFPAPGTYTVTLTVVDSGGLQQTSTLTITVIVVPVPPVAALTFVSGEFTGSPVTLSTTGTTDPDGEIASWFITWGDGGPSDGGTGPPPATLQHTYVGAGTFPVALTVTDNGVPPQQATASMPIVVQAPAPGNPPVTSFALSSGTFLDDSFVFAIDGSDPELGALTWDLDYGDGSTHAIGIAADLPTTRAHNYSAVGSYTAVFRVTDTENLTTTKTLTVAVVNAPGPDPVNVSPVISLSYTSGQFTSEPFVLTVLEVYDPDGSVVSWDMDFGDGTPHSPAAGVPPPTFSHVYATAGTYTPVLQVTDNGGLIGSSSVTVVVQSPPPPPVNQLPTAGLVHASGTYTTDTHVFQLTGSDPDGTVVGWSLDVGDGTALVTGTTLPAARNHVYAVVGTYTARLTVTDNSGGTKTASVTVSVLLPPPPPSPGTHPYYESLVARVDKLHAFPLRSQSELDTYRTSACNNGEYPQVYDPIVDATLGKIDPAVTGRNTICQKHLPMVLVPDQNFLQTWDHIIDSGFQYLGAGYMDTYKTYRWLAGVNGFPPWGIMKHWFKFGTEQQPGSLARYGFTCDNSTYVGPGGTYVSEQPGPITNLFYMYANRWTRTWFFYEAATQRLSVWVADAVQGVVQLLNQIPYALPSVGLQVWRIQYDSSFNQFPALNPLAKAWNRNVVVLQGPSYATTLSLLSTQGL